MSAHHQDHGAALEKVALEALLRDPDCGVDVLFGTSSGKRQTHRRWHQPVPRESVNDIVSARGVSPKSIPKLTSSRSTVEAVEYTARASAILAF
jgi:hypothetical protein